MDHVLASHSPRVLKALGSLAFFFGFRVHNLCLGMSTHRACGHVGAMGACVCQCSLSVCLCVARHFGSTLWSPVFACMLTIESYAAAKQHVHVSVPWPCCIPTGTIWGEVHGCVVVPVMVLCVFEWEAAGERVVKLLRAIWDS